MSTVAPGRTVEQRTAALERANRVRLFRADVKRQVVAGSVSVVSLLADPPDALLSMPVHDLVLAQPRWGRVRTRKLFGRLGISTVKTIGGLTTRQRVELIDALKERAR